MELTINGKSFELRFSFKAEMLFETINGESFTAQSTTAWVQQLFCYIIATLGDGSIKYEEYLAWLDENPAELYEFIEWYTTTMSNINEIRQAASKKETGVKEKDGKSRKK